MQGSQPCAAAWLYLKHPQKTARGQCAHIYGGVLDSRTERVGLRTVRLERDFTPGKQVFRIYVYITGFPAYDADAMLHWATMIDQLPEGEV